MPGAASASVRDLTPTWGLPTQIGRGWGCTEKSRGVLTMFAIQILA